MSKDKKDNQKFTPEGFPLTVIESPDGRKIEAVQARYTGPGTIKFNGSEHYGEGSVGLFPRATVEKYNARAGKDLFLPPDAEWKPSSLSQKEKLEAEKKAAEQTKAEGGEGSLGLDADKAGEGEGAPKGEPDVLVQSDDQGSKARSTKASGGK